MNDTDKCNTKCKENIHSFTSFPGRLDQNQQSQYEAQLTGNRRVSTVECFGEESRCKTKRQQGGGGSPPAIRSSSHTPQNGEQCELAQQMHTIARRKPCGLL